MSRLTVRERIEKYIDVDGIMVSMDDAIEYFTNACDMCRTGLGFAVDETLNRTWYQVAKDMEAVIKSFDPDEGPYIVDEIRCFGY